MLDPITAVVVGGLTGASIYQGERARKESKKAAQAQQRISNRQSQKEKISQLREAQIARAQVSVQSQAMGTQDASTTSGITSSIGSTAGANVQFINTINSLQQEISRRMQKANDFAANAQTLGSLASLGASFVKPPTATGGGGVSAQASSVSNPNSQLTQPWGF